jgi:AcrR family transcriptional regulator
LLEEVGYSGLRIAELCTRAEISPTSLYWHFGDKAGLMRAIVDHTTSAQLGRIRALVAESENGDALASLTRALGELVREQPLGTLTGLAVLSEGSHLDRALSKALREARLAERAEITRYVSRRLRCSESLAHDIAILIAALTNYAALSQRLDTSESDADRVLDTLQRILASLTEPFMSNGG